MAEPAPLVGVTACRKRLDAHWFHIAGEKYVAAVAVAAGGVPVVLPALGRRLALDALLERLDGVVLTGSPSNVHPRHYDAELARPDTELDPHRDATTLALARRAVERGVPLLAICRGFQELNVAHGGTLHQHVHEVEGLADHRDDPARPLEERYGPAHEVTLEPGGLLAHLAGARRVTVNSLHGQGVDRLGEGLEVEARAPDGLVEAFRVAGAPAFALAVQWHPEWRVLEDPLSSALFAAFGDAARARAARRRRDAFDPAVV